MEIRSIKQIAEEQNVSYEAIRKMIVRYSDELKDHITRKNRTQYLDEWAVEFLKEKRRENPVVLYNMDQNEQIEELKAQVELLKNKLLASQEQLLSLQSEVKEGIENKVKCSLLLEDNKAKDERLKEAIEKEAELKRTVEKISAERDEAQAEVRSYHKTFFGLYKKDSVDSTIK